MATKLTLKTLLRYHYQETSKEQNEQIENALETDWYLKEEYLMMKETLNGLDGFKKSPSHSCIQGILDYSNRSTPVSA